MALALLTLTPLSQAQTDTTAVPKSLEEFMGQKSNIKKLRWSRDVWWFNTDKSIDFHRENHAFMRLVHVVDPTVPGSIQYKPPSDNSELGRAISSVADYGNRGTDDYFGRFLPEMGQRNVNEARATGRSLMSNIQKFQGKVPELGDPKDLFEFYLGKIKD